MKMILHIFRKDVRHLYPEILVVALLTAGFGWVAPSQWNGGVHDVQGMLAVLLRFLLPIGWLVLISMLVHEESLAGDRQFWITRPYRWTELLASKALFICCFIAIPFVVVRLYLLHHAGLDMSHAWGALAISTTEILLAIVLPVTAIATVTTGFAKDILLVLVATVYIFVLTMFYSWFVTAQMLVSSLIIFLAVCAGATLVAIITTQYAIRSTRKNGIILAVLPAALLLILLAAPMRLLIHSAYPESPDQLGKLISFDTDPHRQQPGSHVPNVIYGNVYVDVPMTSNATQDQVLFRNIGGAVNITDEHGFHWHSNYEYFGTWFGKSMNFTFFMPASKFGKLQTATSDLEVEFDGEKYQNVVGQPSRIAEDGSFVSPEGGNCSVGVDETSLTCFYALRLSDWTQIKATTSDQPCMISDKGVKKSWVTYLRPTPMPTSLDFDPVVAMHVGAPGRHFCPDTEVQFTTSPSTGRERFSVAFDGVNLKDYVWSNFGRMAVKSY